MQKALPLLDQGGDVLDYRQMAYGAAGIPREYAWTIHYWESRPGQRVPIKGLFEADNPLRAAKCIQERIHFLGFVKEHSFDEGEIQRTACYLANWHLFSSEADARGAYETYPLADSVLI